MRRGQRCDRDEDDRATRPARTPGTGERARRVFQVPYSLSHTLLEPSGVVIVSRGNLELGKFRFRAVNDRWQATDVARLSLSAQRMSADDGLLLRRGWLYRVWFYGDGGRVVVSPAAVDRRDRREGPSSNNTRPVFLSDDDINGANAEQQQQYQQQQAAAAACAV